MPGKNWGMDACSTLFNPCYTRGAVEWREAGVARRRNKNDALAKCFLAMGRKMDDNPVEASTMKIIPTGFSYIPTLFINGLALAVACLAGGCAGSQDWYYLLAFQLFVLLLGNELWVYGILFPAMSRHGQDTPPDVGDVRLRRALKRTSPLMFLSPCLVYALLELLIWSLDRMGVIYPSFVNDLGGECLVSLYGLGLLFTADLFLPLAPLSVFSLLNTEDDGEEEPPPLPPGS